MLKPLSLSDSSSGVSIPREQELGDGEISWSSEFWKARGRAQRQIFDYTHLSAYHHSLGTWLADFCAVSRHMNPLSPLILPNDLTAWPVFSVSNLHMCFSNSVVVMGLREEACLKPMCPLCCFLGIFSPCLSDFLHWFNEKTGLCDSPEESDVLEHTQTLSAFISFRKFGRPEGI